MTNLLVSMLKNAIPLKGKLDLIVEHLPNGIDCSVLTPDKNRIGFFTIVPDGDNYKLFYNFEKD